MIVSSTQPEVILDVAGEGGGYTILGEHHEGHWRFWRQAGAGDHWFDDEDGETSTQLQQAPAPPPAICYFPTLDEVLQDINSCWPTLHPIQVHPAFSQDIWSRVVGYDRHRQDRQGLDALASWRQCCLVHEHTHENTHDNTHEHTHEHTHDNTHERTHERTSIEASFPAPWALPAHWHDFASALRLTLAHMEEDQFLILLCKGSSRFVQFAAQNTCMRVEAISNHFLSRRDALSPEDISALHRLGWRPPTGIPEQATPERDPNGSCNFFMEVPLPPDFTHLAALAVETLSTVMGVPHDGYLAYQAFEVSGGDVSFPDLRIKREIADPHLRMGELAQRLLDILKEISACATLDFDEDGDVAVDLDGQSCLVRLLGQPPRVGFYLPLITAAKPGKRLLASLNELNVHGGPVRHVWMNDTVYAMLDIPAWPLQVRHVEDSLALFANVATKSALRLQSACGIDATAFNRRDMPH